ncbi:MAG: cation:proton antiporter [Chthoniobacterales bacterium]
MPSFLDSLILAAADGHGDHKLTVFFTQIALLVLVGRLLGELMQRIGQPAVIGQLLAGIALGPSIFGAVWPSAQHFIFPVSGADRQMLTGVAELGVLMLLLLTGMETDLALVKRVRRTAMFTSAAGIIIPFACGYFLGEFLPDSILPDPARRGITSLFLATALSISSVKIVAAVLREVDYLRRSLGQVILASAILDDTIGWIILAFISGVAAHGKIVLGPLLLSVFGTAFFLLFCFTIGKQWVARIIRWSNDAFSGEMPVISVILLIMLGLALLTNGIGVHTVLGAFMAGIMIGQSPILTKHIDQQLRGLIVALFMPVFFGVAGLSIDLKVLVDPHLLELTLLLIVIATIGKLGGCYLGGRLSGLNHPESLAIGLGMNARGSTEVILATIGLGIGVLNQSLFTIIVLMAVVTTLIMPPLLRWTLARVPIRKEEKERLETEEAEEKDGLPKIERILVGLNGGDDSLDRRFPALLMGWFIGARQLSATVIDLSGKKKKEDAKTAALPGIVVETAKSVIEAEFKHKSSEAKKAQTGEQPAHPLDAAALSAEAETVSVKELFALLTPGADKVSTPELMAETILTEAKNGYGMLFLSIGDAEKYTNALQKILRDFPGPVAILFEPKNYKPHTDDTLTNILVPTTGADYSRFGAEVATAIARGSKASVTVLHVSVASDNELFRRPSQLLREGRSISADIKALGKREGVSIVAKTVTGGTKQSTILREVKSGHHELIVLGTKSKSEEEIHFGTSAMALLEKATCPVLVVKS